MTYQQKTRQRVIDKLGSKCAKCGFADSRALQVDHVEGDGWKDRGNQYGMYKKILAGQEGYQLLCANCNWIKRSINDEAVGKGDGPTNLAVSVDSHTALLWSV